MKANGVKNIDFAIKAILLHIQWLALVQVQNLMAFFKQAGNQMSADESRTAGDNDAFHKLKTKIVRGHAIRNQFHSEVPFEQTGSAGILIFIPYAVREILIS